MISFETNRLIIRPFKKDDYLSFYDYMSKDNVVHFEPYKPFTIDDCMATCLKHESLDEQIFWAVCLKETNELIGHLFFASIEPKKLRTYSIGYVFNPKFYGNGYATESCKAMLEYGFNTLMLHRVVAYVDVLNKPSWSLLKRLGMRRESHCLKNNYFNVDENNNPIWKDNYQYAMLSTEYK